MRIERRTLLKGLPLTAALFAVLPWPGALAEETYIPRVGGEVTPQNFGGLSNLAMHSIGGIVGLKISIADGEHDGLVAGEVNGQLVVYLRNGAVELSFPSGYRKDRERYFFDGFYSVSSSDKKQGINAILLTPARTMDVEATGKPTKDFSVGELPAKMKGG